MSLLWNIVNFLAQIYMTRMVWREVYSGPCRKSMMELFCGNSQRLLAELFSQKMFDKVLQMLLLRENKNLLTAYID